MSNQYKPDFSENFEEVEKENIPQENLSKLPAKTIGEISSMINAAIDESSHASSSNKAMLRNMLLKVLSETRVLNSTKEDDTELDEAELISAILKRK